jgi:hypothetical protein
MQHYKIPTTVHEADSFRLMRWFDAAAVSNAAPMTKVWK